MYIPLYVVDHWVFFVSRPRFLLTCCVLSFSRCLFRTGFVFQGASSFYPEVDRFLSSKQFFRVRPDDEFTFTGMFVFTSSLSLSLSLSSFFCFSFFKCFEGQSSSCGARSMWRPGFTKKEALIGTYILEMSRIKRG
jgi:hypothetical protein